MFKTGQRVLCRYMASALDPEACALWCAAVVRGVERHAGTYHVQYDAGASERGVRGEFMRAEAEPGAESSLVQQLGLDA